MQNQNTEQIVDDVTDVIRHLNAECGIPLADIARDSPVTESAVKQFMLRGAIRPRTNKTLVWLLKYIQKNANLLENSNRDLLEKICRIQDYVSSVEENKNGLLYRLFYTNDNPFAGLAYKQILKMVNAPIELADKIGDKVEGKYSIYRITDREAKKIELTKMEVYRYNNREVWSYKHHRKDGMMVATVTKGFMIPMSNTIYFIGNIEKGYGMEMMVVREPISDEFSFMRGSIIYLDSNRDIVTSDILMARIDDDVFLNDCFGEIHLEEIAAFHNGDVIVSLINKMGKN